MLEATPNATKRPNRWPLQKKSPVCERVLRAGHKSGVCHAGSGGLVRIELHTVASRGILNAALWKLLPAGMDRKAPSGVRTGVEFDRMITGANTRRRNRTSLAALAAVLLAGAAPGAACQGLTIDGAVAIALGANDPTVARFAERASALDDRAVSDSQLPDPQLRE